MSWRNETVAAAAMAVSLVSLVHAYDFGRPAMIEEIKLWDIDVRPDGKGLPEGSGTVAHGKSVYEENCEACHGPNGQGGIKDRLAGGQGSLATENPIKTVGSYWPYATTLFDYIHRAMPYQAPGSLRTARTLTESRFAVLRRSDSGLGDSGVRRTGVGRSHDRRGSDSAALGGGGRASR